VGRWRITTLPPQAACKFRSGGLGETPSRRRFVAQKKCKWFSAPPPRALKGHYLLHLEMIMRLPAHGHLNSDAGYADLPLTCDGGTSGGPAP
jgi:hypothetical protein